MKKRIIAFLLFFAVLISCMPVGVLAAETNEKKELEPFSDVNQSDWFYDAVVYNYGNSIFNGMTDTEFAPQSQLSRGMFVTILGRMAGVDPSKYTGSDFPDVAEHEYYAPYVKWAAQYGITVGTGDGMFSPDANVTREQMATFFMRYFESFDVVYSDSEDITSVPGDIQLVSEWAKDSVLKFWKSGLLIGDGVNFNPQGDASRAEAATLCMRTDESVKTWFSEPGVPSTRVSKSLEELKNPTSGPRYYTVRFDTNGGRTIPYRIVSPGEKLGELPTPYYEGKIFVGWFYDKQFQREVNTDDRVWSSKILYASYISGETLVGTRSEYFTAAENVDRDFTIGVRSSDSAMTLSDVQANIEIEMLSDPNHDTIPDGTDFMTVSEADGTYVIAFTGDGYFQGETYRVTLKSDKLTFEGALESTREYNITTAEPDEVCNISYAPGVKQLEMSALSNITVNGAPRDTISLALLRIDQNGNEVTAEEAQGTFTYEGSTITEGDVVCISGEEDTAYVRITDVEETKYSFEAANVEEVIFTPDILPVNQEDDLNPDDGDKLTIAPENVDYSAEEYAPLGLSALTLIDAGDYIAFYTGDFSENMDCDLTYAEITRVSFENDMYIIDYVPVDWDDVASAMDLYATQSVEGDTLLEGADVTAIEESIVEQAEESGFAEEAAEYLTALALETDTFTELSDDMNLEDYWVTLEDGASVGTNQVRLASNVGPNIKEISASLGTKLQEFPGYTGVSVTLHIVVEIIIGSGEDTVKIEIAGDFVEEVRVDVDTKAKAIWKVWGIFPYIADFRVTAGIELFDYTGIDIDATIITGSEEDGQGRNLASEIKALLDQAGTSNKAEDTEESLSISETLAQKYNQMLETESDWVELFTQEIVKVDMKLPFNLPLLIIEFELDFVTQVNANVSVGMDFYYKNAKRYLYTINVGAKEVRSDVIDLVEEQYEFDFFIVGTLGVRAGIRATFAIGLFSTDLDSISVSAEAGAYCRLYGYFYYHLEYTASQGRAQNYAGALLIEVGAYLQVELEAQVLKGLVSAKICPVDKEWPLWYIGHQDSILDFTAEQEAMPEVKLKQYIKEAVISDDVFRMDYLDLKSGELAKAIYDDNARFSITFSDDRFSYDPTTNVIKVEPRAGDNELEADMTIVWKSYPLAFSSAPVSRTIHITWDNYRDGYVIVPYTNGGSYVPIIVAAANDAITQPEKPTRLGYEFAGWYADKELNTPYTFPETMGSTDTSIYAKWTPATNTPYKVCHYQQKLGSSEYELVDTVEDTGTTDTVVTTEPKSYEGFTMVSYTGSDKDGQQKLTILPDGSAVMNYYYDRVVRTITFDGGDVCDSVSYELAYGAKVTAPRLFAKGYTFGGWDAEVAETMGAGNVTYTAQWTLDPKYTVEYYVSQPDCTYKLTERVEKTIGEDRVIDLEALKISIENARFEAMTYTGVTVGEDGTAAKAAGETVIKLLYVAEGTPAMDRKKQELKIDYVNVRDTSTDATFQTPQFAENEIVTHQNIKKVFNTQLNPVVLNDPKVLDQQGNDITNNVGYTFAGWYTDAALTNKVPFITPFAYAEDITLYAKWVANPYTVVFDANFKDGASTSTDTQLFVYDVAQKLTANAFTSTGYTFKGWTTEQNSGSVDFVDGAEVSKLAPKGELRLYAVWELDVYNITYNGVDVGGSGNTNPATYTVESNDIVLSAPTTTKDGYQFLGWFDADGKQVTSINKGSHGDVTLTARWAHGGIFSVEHTSTEGGTSTYTVTRTLPTDAENVEFTDTVQQVYYRTLNGTAIGGTAEAIHFTHVGGPNVFLTFDKSDTSKTFTVSGENAKAVYTGTGSLRVIAAGYTTENVNRYYTVELYKVATTQGGLVGSIAKDGMRVNHNIGTGYTISESVLSNKVNTIYDNTHQNTETTIYGVEGTTERNQGTAYYSKNPSFEFTYSSDGTYLAQTGSMGFKFVSKMTERYKGVGEIGYELIKFDAITSSGSQQIADQMFELSDNKTTSEIFSMKFPPLGGLFGRPEFYSLPGGTQKVKASFSAYGKDKNIWWVLNPQGIFQFTDTTAPDLMGFAPLAFGDYAVGDTVAFSLIYDEIVKEASYTKESIAALMNSYGIAVDSDSITYTGVGTNVITFTATVSEAFKVDTSASGAWDINNALVNKQYTTGVPTVQDYAGHY